jgi:hypothetical protein
MNNEVFQDRFMVLTTPYIQERFLPILKDERLLFHCVECKKFNTVEYQDVVFLSTNSLNVGVEYEITVPEIFEPTVNFYLTRAIFLQGFVDIDILGRKVEMKVNQLQRFSIKIISKEELLEKIGEQMTYSIQHTIQKYPSIVNKIK